MSLTPPPLRSGSVPACAVATAGMGGAQPLPPPPPAGIDPHPSAGIDPHPSAGIEETGASRWLLLQLVDAGFPTGGFAHSAGLEAAAHLGETRGAQGLDRYARAYLWNVGSAALPFVAAAHEEPAALADLDALVDAVLVRHVSDRASRTQSRACAG